MSQYWLNPPRQHIIDWLIARYPFDRARYEKMKLSQLRAIWHKEMNEWFGKV